MRVVFIINDLNYFSIHRQLLAIAWLDRGWQVTVLAGQPRGETPELDPRLKVVLMPFARHRLSPWRDMVSMAKVHRASNPNVADIVHAFTIKAVLLAGLSAIAHRRTSGLVLTFAGLGKIFEPSKTRSARLRRRITTTILQRIEKRCKPWTTFENQDDCAQAINIGFAESVRCKVIQGAGIDLTVFTPPEKKRHGPLKFVMASRLITTKGVDTFLEVAKRLHGTADFTLTGPRDDEDVDAVDESMIANAVHEGTIKWRGATPMAEMGDLFRDHDVAVLPTRLKEGFPRSLLEAAACGCALIASRQNVIETIVRPGETGWLLDEPDANALAKAVERAVRNPKRTRKMGENAAALVSSMKADTDSVVENMHVVYMRTVEASDCRYGK